jgi:predicted RNA-binding protein with PUA-like domain
MPTRASQARVSTTAMRYWVMKSEPDEFSIDDLARKGREPWSGVRNYQARNFMRDSMQPGDRVLFYHSSCAEPGVAGIARIASTAYPDPSQFERKSPYFDPKSARENPRWLLVDVEFERKLRGVVSLDQIKHRAARFPGLILLQRGNRLSVFPIERNHYDGILSLEPPA